MQVSKMEQISLVLIERLLHFVVFGIFIIAAISVSGTLVTADNEIDVVIAIDQSTGTSLNDFNLQKDLASSLIYGAPTNYHFRVVKYGELAEPLLSLWRNQPEGELLPSIKKLQHADMGPRNNTYLFSYVDGFVFRKRYKIPRTLMMLSASEESPSKELAKMSNSMDVKIFTIGFGTRFKQKTWKYVASTPGKHVHWIESIGQFREVKEAIVKQLIEDADYPCATDEYLSDSETCKTCKLVCLPFTRIAQCTRFCPYNVHESYQAEQEHTDFNDNNKKDSGSNTVYNIGIGIAVATLILIALSATFVCKYYNMCSFFNGYNRGVTTTAQQPFECTNDQTLVRAELQSSVRGNC